MQTIEFFEEAVAKAEKKVSDQQAIYDDWTEKESALIQRMEALQARKAEINSQIKTEEEVTIAAVSNGTKTPENKTPALMAEASAIDKVLTTFPTDLANHRERSSSKHNGLHAAKGELATANLNLAVRRYQDAMQDVWDLADAVRECAGGISTRLDLTGLADSRNAKFGRVTENSVSAGTHRF